MKKQIAILVAILSLWVSTSIFGIGTFLDTPYSSKASALGQSQVASADGSDAIFWNPSLLKHNDQDLKISMFQAFESNFYSVQSQLNILGLPIGIQWLRAQVDGFQAAAHNTDTGRYYLTGESFGYSGNALYLASAYELNGISVGAAVKGISEQSSGLDASGFGVDIGASTKIFESITLGLTANNIYSSLKNASSSNQTEQLTKKTKAGFGWQGANTSASGDLIFQDNRPTLVAAGVEHVFQHTLAIRAGYFNNTMSYGAGLMLDAMNMDVSVTMHPDYIGNVYQLTAGYNF